jgi:hypothetical protein
MNVNCPNCYRPVAYGPPRADTCACSTPCFSQPQAREAYTDFTAQKYLTLKESDAMYAERALWNARLAARACCRAHGTTCPDCRAKPSRLRDLLDLLRVWWRHG